MKYIAIIAAEDKEVEALCEIMTDISVKKILGVNIYTGKSKGKDCLVAKSGVGKVNAARTTQIIIDKFDVDYIINTGSAGAVCDDLVIGDIIISTGLVQYDFDVTAFGREKGFIPETGKIFETDKFLTERFEKASKMLGIDWYKGYIASGDRFLAETEDKVMVAHEFNALCCEMEGAAVAQVCKLSNVPFSVVRSVSDTLTGDAKVNFNEYLEVASKKCAAIIYNTI